jgi:hypothetical protein
MARNVLVQCMCDCCGKTVYCRANYNEHHNLYEDGLPEGWEFIDNADFSLIKHTGDHCPDCLASFVKYMEIFCRRWLKYVRLKNNRIPEFVANDQKFQEVSP